MVSVGKKYSKNSSHERDISREDDRCLAGKRERGEKIQVHVHWKKNILI